MNKLLIKLSSYADLVLRLAFLFVFIRIGEVLVLYTSQAQQLSFTLFIKRSINFDMLFVMISSLLFLPLYLLLTLREKERYGIVLFKWYSFLLLILNLILTDFFLISGFLMPAFVLEFSFSDMIHVFGTEFTGRNWNVFLLDVVILVLFYFLMLRQKVRKIESGFRFNLLLYAYIIISIVSVVNIRHLSKDQKYYDNKFQYYLGSSKLENFIKNVQQWRKNRTLLENSTDEDIVGAIVNFRKHKSYSRFISDQYPLLQINECGNHLGPFFKKSESRPNIVLVVVESLSSTFCGTKTLYGSLTPFLDSLRQQGLYWENFYSNADRTFGALPNLLASLPYGFDSRGFINSVKVVGDEIRYPNHLTLIDVLKKNDYKSHFFYGGWDGFDNMTFYFKYLGVDKKINDESFDETVYNRKKHSETAWGYDDKQLYDRSFEDIDSLTADDAFINIYLTISNHSPFALADSIYYERSFQEERLKNSNLQTSINDMGPVSNEELASILFTDDALREMFNRYKKRSDFDRTIFIVVGDHGGGSLATSNKLSPYQVPLIIYSKLLNKPTLFKGLSSHLDVLPSLQCLLEENYNLKTPATHTYIGQGLDTSRSWNTDRMIPLMIWSKERASFMLNNLVLEGDEVYYLNEDGKTYEECRNSKEIEEIKSAHRSYLLMNTYTLKNKRIWPEDIDLN